METTYKFDGVTVRIHGAISDERIKTATTQFLKEVERRKRKTKVEKGA